MKSTNQPGLFGASYRGDLVPELREPRDLSKGAEAPTSREAFKRIKNDLPMEQWFLLEWLINQLDGGTAKEFALWHEKTLNAVSGRFSELQAKGLIYKTTDRRDGCAVWRVVRC